MSVIFISLTKKNSLIFKSMVRTIQNKMFWKLMLKRQSPDINAINVNYEMFKKSVNEFETYFLGTKDFVGGADLNISGAQSFTTFLMADLHKKSKQSYTSSISFFSSLSEQTQSHP